jgi:hypothetical protein
MPLNKGIKTSTKEKKMKKGKRKYVSWIYVLIDKGEERYFSFC